jgi:hypothetical protein
MGRKRKLDKMIYYITASDIQEVAIETYGRDLTPDEIKLVQDRVGDFINWYDAIEMAIEEKIQSGELVFVESDDEDDEDIAYK